MIFEDFSHVDNFVSNDDFCDLNDFEAFFDLILTSKFMMFTFWLDTL